MDVATGSARPWSELVFAFLKVGFAALIWLAIVPQVGAQDDPDARARVYFDAGTEAYEAQDFATALDQFRRAYAVSGRAELQYNIGQAAERAGQLGVAISSFERFVREVPDSPRKPEVERNLVVLRAQAQAQGIEFDEPEPTAEPAPAPTAEPAPVETSTEVSTPVAPSPTETAQTAVPEPLSEPQHAEEPSIVESPWLWVGVAALVVGGIVLAVVLSQDSINEDAHGTGTFGTLNALAVK